MAAEPAVLQLKSALLIVFFALLLWWFRKWWILILVFVLVLTFLQRWPNNDWQIANCDVGQGDAMVLKVNTRSAVVIDVGSDPAVIDQCLKSLRIEEIPLLILTHPHQDHIGGFIGAIKNRRVVKVLSKAQRGEQIQVGNLRIEILWPDGAIHNFTDNGGEGSEINNQSIVALVSAPDYTLLTTGDIEPDAQSMITVPKVKFLKVAHHGSRYQNLNFNRMADPDLAIVSVGKENRYGHPDKQTLKLFRKVLRTDQNGAIAIDPKKMSISSSKVGVLGLPVLWRIA